MADFSVFVDSDDTSSERRISPGWSIATLKQKLWPITGIPPASQTLSIPYASEEDLVATFRIEPLSVLRVGDRRPRGQRPNYTDDSNVDKFELSREEYESRTDSVLAYKRRNRLGRFDPEAGSREEAAVKEAGSLGLVVGARCRVEGSADRRGTVRYVGPVSKIPAGGGVWVGVEYDEPVGKNDGSVQDVRYFETKANHGGFLRPGKVRVGDYPVRDLDDELMDSEDEI